MQLSPEFLGRIDQHDSVIHRGAQHRPQGRVDDAHGIAGEPQGEFVGKHTFNPTLTELLDSPGAERRQQVQAQRTGVARQGPRFDRAGDEAEPTLGISRDGNGHRHQRARSLADLGNGLREKIFGISLGAKRPPTADAASITVIGHPLSASLANTGHVRSYSERSEMSSFAVASSTAGFT